MNQSQTFINQNWQQSAHENFYAQTSIPNGEMDGSYKGETTFTFRLFSIHDKKIAIDKDFDISGDEISVSITLHLYTQDNKFVFNDNIEPPQISLSIEYFLIVSTQKLIAYKDSIEIIKRNEYKDFYDFILKNIEKTLTNIFLKKSDLKIEDNEIKLLIDKINYDLNIIFPCIKEQKKPQSSQLKIFKNYCESQYLSEISQIILQETIKTNAFELKNKIESSLKEEVKTSGSFKKI